MRGDDLAADSSGGGGVDEVFIEAMDHSKVAHERVLFIRVYEG